ncbi:MAG TPA: polymorphic toxin-type HINT domain-containing protein, partial [Pirellulales bacterium]|nr:polymorphic toxin-type HINT domain-containing protein [Pirellulales bacterium]
TLAEMHMPEASIALARLAALSDSPDVVDAATVKLKSQPAHNYIPAMLASLVAPEGVQTTIVYGRNGRLLFRQAFLHEGADRKSLVVFDDAYQGFVNNRSGSNGQTQLMASELGSAVVSQRARFADALDRRFERQNERICKTLRDVTGQRLTANPADWWKWWDDYNETVQEGSKPVETTYFFEATPLVSLTPQRMHCACLVAGTPIWTDRGAVAVEKMHVGDRVLAQDPISGELAYKLVLRTTVREHSGVVYVNLPGDQIVASGGHPFWVAGSGWINARHLEPGMLLHGVEGATAIESVKVDDHANQTVYNLVVEDSHDYFAGNSRRLLHDITPREPTRGPLPGLEETPQAKAQGAKTQAVRAKF